MDRFSYAASTKAVGAFGRVGTAPADAISFHVPGGESLVTPDEIIRA